MAIRFRLGEVMEQRGLDQKDIIEITGLSRNTVKVLALGAIARVDFESLNKLCMALSVTPGDLIEYTPDSK
ncbi:helix-turn-helix domain-containing protein [Brevibacillus reuszeri]|uniref:helix-turn-helix domain-containing protein n=1 Tax=Brevibacillus reuszeri TaxID=54915 RepID=UPI000CCC497E|nr:helix-turn-helix domain-containing protein [Brevibacillus reuszeri]